MIIPNVIPRPVSPVTAGGAVMNPPDSPDVDPEVSKLEEEALREHLAEVQGYADALNAAKAAEGVPVLGDAAAMTLPLPRNEAKGGLEPLDNADAWVARGYMDIEGNITPAGENYFLLEDQGLFDQRGQLTEKGDAFALPYEATLLPEFKKQFIIRDKAGLNEKSDVGLGDLVKATGGFLWDAVKGTAKLAASTDIGNYYTAGLFTPDTQAEKEAEKIILGQEFAESSIESPMALASGALSLRDQFLSSMTGDDEAYYTAKQNHARLKEIQQDMDAAELMGTLGASEATVAGIAENRALAEQFLGAQRSAELAKQGEAAGALVGDPSNIASMGIGGVVGGGLKLPNVSRNIERSIQAGLQAEDAAAALAKAKAIADKTQRAAGIAAKQAENLRLTGINPARMEALAGKMAGTHMEASQQIPLLEQRAIAAAAHADEMAKLAGGADKVAAALETASQIGRTVRAAPAKAIAPVVEKIGDTILKLDSGLDDALNKLGMTDEIRSRVGKVTGAVAGLTVGGPVGAIVGSQIPGAIKATLAAGPVIRGVGNFTRVLGQELMQARGTTPFWQRVAQNSAISPVGRATAHAVDNLTLGGKALAPIRLAGSTARGVAAAAPVDIAFEIIAEGDMSPQTLKQGLAESLVFAGPAALGGAMVKGDLNTLRAKAAGDEINLRKRLDPDSLAGFSRMPKGVRKNLSIYSGAFPTLDFKITEDGPNAYDRNTNTVFVNRNSPDALKGIVAHEVNHYLQVKSQAEDGIKALLVGDMASGGLLRAADGTLDPNFEAAMDEYNARLEAIGRDPLSVEDFAIEYFTEATVNDLLDATESGDLQRMAGRSTLERMVRDVSRNLIAKAPILQNLFYNTGGATDSKGGMVQGNGLLADGIRELPGARAMVRKMMEESAGRTLEQIPRSKLTPEGDEKVKIAGSSLKGNKALADSFFGVLKTDADGNVILGPDGVPETIDKATDTVRSQAGIIIKEMQADKIRNGQPLAEGEIAPVNDPAMPNIDFAGTHVPEDLIRKVAERAKLNRRQEAMWLELNRSSKEWDGATFNLIYQPALKTTKTGRKVYDGLEATFREVVPLGESTTKKGNILIHFFSVTKFTENIKKKAKTALGKELYKGDENAIRDDAQAVMKLHREGKTTDAYFAAKYGEIEGKRRKNFINTVFGLMTPKQRDVNPLFALNEVAGPNGVYRTYRLDRINKVTRLQGKPLPFSYEGVKMNLFPNGIDQPGGANIGDAALAGIQKAVISARKQLDARRAARNEASVSWVLYRDPLDEDDAGRYYPEAKLPPDDAYLKPFLPLESIVGVDGKWYFGEEINGFDSAEEAMEHGEEVIREALKEEAPSSTFGSDSDAREFATEIFAAFPRHPAIQKGWDGSKWGSWYLEFKDEDEGRWHKISVRDHSPARADMGLPDRSFYVSKNWNPEEVGRALESAWEYIQEKSPTRSAEAEDMAEARDSAIK